MTCINIKFQVMLVIFGITKLINNNSESFHKQLNFNFLINNVKGFQSSKKYLKLYEYF